ncbi:UNC-50 family protein [Hortaea werneckii]|nr:UNC-50 family protein [Hortaea werneckii]KAI7015923.1 UNC-50 family protein [Hortaea werneckii]KAI7196895.1 UNC-50 family protein [Hortaea werneckii]KAI7579477.1 UNC-50 family protein [Hortaea werneckii]KAI7670232.1 UNC-50 family protein [Hortaea werneckii]
MKVPPFFRRLFKFTSMDFETAVWEMINLIIAPKKVFRNIYYHTKNSYHRADPAFTYLLSLFFWLTGLAWGLAYADGFGRAVKISFAFVLFHLLGSSVIVSTLMYFLVGKVLGKRRQGLFGPPNGGEEELEFGYCFDVSIRAFTPIWVFLYVLQFLLMPLIAQDYWVSNFFGNTMFLLALSYYFIIIFLGFNAQQAAAYASGRGDSYPQPLYQTILDFHQGKRDLCMDVGTGPGKAVWDLLAYFSHCIGSDASEQMIQRAKQEALSCNVSHRTTFLTVEAEYCGDHALLHHVGFEPNSIDLITVAMAAHWFQFPAFHLSAAQALRSGGTLAIWTTSSYSATPPYQGIGTSEAYFIPSKTRCDEDAENPSAAAFFDEAAFERKHWDRDGVPSAPALPDGSPGPYLLGREVDLQGGLKGFDSSGPMFRWREANPEKAHSDQDPIRVIADRLMQVVGEQTNTRRSDVVDDGAWIWCFLERLDVVQKLQSSDSRVSVRCFSSVSKVWTNSKDAE